MRQHFKSLENPYGKLSKGSDEWISIDCGDIGIHLFSPESRKEYNLDALWDKEIADFDEDAILENLKKNEKYLLEEEKQSAYSDSDSDEAVESPYQKVK